MGTALGGQSRQGCWIRLARSSGDREGQGDGEGKGRPRQVLGGQQCLPPAPQCLLGGGQGEGLGEYVNRYPRCLGSLNGPK